MATLTLVVSVFDVIAFQTVTLGVCTSILKIIWVLVNKESIPVACLIQQEGTLMSMLGYIVMATQVSCSYCACTSRSSADHLPVLI